MEFIGLTGSVVKHLRNKIITCAFTPGQKLNEIELSSSLKISRAPLRESFCALESEYLINRIPRKGTYVTEISVNNLKEVYSVRSMIECHAIDILKTRNERELPEAYSSLINAWNLSAPLNNDENEVADYLRGLTDFHAKLVASTHNPWLMAFYDSLVSTLARYQYFCLKVPGLPLRSQAMHKQILDSINKGAFDEAKEALASHIESTVEFISVYVSKELEKVA